MCVRVVYGCACVRGGACCVWGVCVCERGCVLCMGVWGLRLCVYGDEG